MVEEKRLRLSEASQLTGYSRNTLRKLVQAGTLEAEVKTVPWGGQLREEYRIPESSLKSYVQRVGRINRVVPNKKVEKKPTLTERILQLERDMEKMQQELKTLKDFIEGRN